MTCEPLQPDLFRLTFPEPEAYFIVSVLARMARHYAEDVGELPPALRRYWQGIMRDDKKEDKEALRDSREMLDDMRTELRSERMTLAENWVREFELAEERNPWIVDIGGAERDDFVSMLNDRRLTLSCEFSVTENDMEMDPMDIVDEARRAAVIEIDVLGIFIMITLGPQIPRP